MCSDNTGTANSIYFQPSLVDIKSLTCPTIKCGPRPRHHLSSAKNQPPGLPYSRIIWCELNLADWQSTFATAKLKATNTSYWHNIIYIW